MHECEWHDVFIVSILPISWHLNLRSGPYSLPIQLYLVDAFRFAASATAAAAVSSRVLRSRNSNDRHCQQVFRSMLGFVFPLFGQQMFDALGLGGGNSVRAPFFIMLFFWYSLMIVIVFFFSYWPDLRLSLVFLFLYGSITGANLFDLIANSSSDHPGSKLISYAVPSIFHFAHWWSRLWRSCPLVHA